MRCVKRKLNEVKGSFGIVSMIEIEWVMNRGIKGFLFAGKVFFLPLLMHPSNPPHKYG